MSQRTHFWLRIVGVTIILVLEFGPRLWSGAALPSSSHAGMAVIGPTGRPMTPRADGRANLSGPARANLSQAEARANLAENASTATP